MIKFKKIFTTKLFYVNLIFNDFNKEFFLLTVEKVRYKDWSLMCLVIEDIFLKKY